MRHGFFDLKVYYGALTWWVHDGGEIYDYLKPGTQYGFTYPPFAALVMLPMAYLPWPAAIAVSVLASVATTAVLIWWLVDPIARRAGWTRWFALAVALCLAAAFEPMRETVNFGQVNMLLLFLVAVDLLRLLPGGNRWAGVGIGLATAIKLTPGIFIVYLLVTRRWRAAFTASGAAAGGDPAGRRALPGRLPRVLDRGAVEHRPGGRAGVRLQPVAARGGGPARPGAARARWSGWLLVLGHPGALGVAVPAPPSRPATRRPGWR